MNKTPKWESDHQSELTFNATDDSLTAAQSGPSLLREAAGSNADEGARTFGLAIKSYGCNAWTT
jgi:hypothetical protein